MLAATARDNMAADSRPRLIKTLPVMTQRHGTGLSPISAGTTAICSVTASVKVMPSLPTAVGQWYHVADRYLPAVQRSITAESRALWKARGRLYFRKDIRRIRVRVIPLLSGARSGGIGSVDRLAGDATALGDRGRAPTAGSSSTARRPVCRRRRGTHDNACSSQT